MGRLRRSSSSITVSEVFPTVIQPELNSMEPSLVKILLQFGKTDKRYIGGLIGGSILAVLGFVIFTGATIIGGVVGGVLGFGLGNALGRRWRRNKLANQNLTREKIYELRLSCLIEYLKRIKKSSVPISEFAAILEYVVHEFRPALVLQLHNPGLQKEVQKLKKILANNASHAALINSVAELRYSIDYHITTHITAARLKHIYIPIMQLLKQPVEKEDRELEVVRQIEDLLADKKTIKLLRKSQIHDEDLIDQIIPFTAVQCSYVGSVYSACQVVADTEHFLRNKHAKKRVSDKDCESIKHSQRLLLRRSSLPGAARSHPYIKLLRKDKERLELIKKVSESIETFNPPLFPSNNDNTEDGDAIGSLEIPTEIEPNIRINFDAGVDRRDSTLNLPPRSPITPFKGLVNDLNQSASSRSGSENEEVRNEEVHLDIPKSRKASLIEPCLISERCGEEQKWLETAKIDVCVHKYQSSFDELLAVEREPNLEKV